MPNLPLHHLENSRSFRILWLLEELGLEYQLTQYDRKNGLAPDSLEQAHPMGKAPVLEITFDDNSQSDLTLIESGHIINYLLAKYDPDYQLHPKVDADSETWRDYDFWMQFAEASAMPPLVMRLVFSKIVERSPKLVRPITKHVRKQVETSMIGKNINKVLSLIERHLSENQWFAGSEFSGADIQMAFVVEAANARSGKGGGLDQNKYVNTLNFLNRCQARPAYQKAVEVGGKLDF